MWHLFEAELNAKKKEIERLEEQKVSFKRPSISLSDLKKEYSAKLDHLTFGEKVELLRKLNTQIVWDGQVLLVVI
jgi:hypothetical protein